MSSSEPAQLDPTRSKLLQRKLGALLTWVKPEIVETIGPYDPEPFETFDTRRRDLIAVCEAELTRLTDERVAVLTDRDLPDPEDLRQNWSSFEDGRITRLSKVNLPWYAGGFGHPDYRADFDYWSKMPHFSLEEILCLSVGMEPEHFPAKKISEMQKLDPSVLWPSAAFLLRRIEQLRRQFDPYSQRNKVTPQDFIDWVNRVDFEVVSEFMVPLRALNVGPTEANPPSKRTDKRELDSIAQLFTAMAIEYYGYNPKDLRSPVTKDITDLAASMGLAMTDDTVRKYLKLGARFIPADWKPNDD